MQVFSSEICEILKINFFRTPLVAASVAKTDQIKKKQKDILRNDAL